MTNSRFCAMRLAWAVAAPARSAGMAATCMAASRAKSSAPAGRDSPGPTMPEWLPSSLLSPAASTPPYESFTPDVVLDALAALDLHGDGRRWRWCGAASVHLEDRGAVVVGFCGRPLGAPDPRGARPRSNWRREVPAVARCGRRPHAAPPWRLRFQRQPLPRCGPSLDDFRRRRKIDASWRIHGRCPPPSHPPDPRSQASASHRATGCWATTWCRSMCSVDGKPPATLPSR